MRHALSIARSVHFVTACALVRPTQERAPGIGREREAISDGAGEMQMLTDARRPVEGAALVERVRALVHEGQDTSSLATRS